MKRNIKKFLLRMISMSLAISMSIPAIGFGAFADTVKADATKEKIFA